MKDIKKLTKKFAALFPEVVDTQRVLAYAGIDSSKFELDGTPENRWFSILLKIYNEPIQLDQLLKEAKDANPNDAELSTLIENRKNPATVSTTNRIVDENPEVEKVEEEIEETHDTNPDEEDGREAISERLSNAYEFDISDLERLLANGKLKDLLFKLETIADSISNDFRTDIIQLQGRYSRLEKEIAQGTMDQREMRVEKARISQAMGYYIEQIPEERELAAIIASSKPSFSNKVESNVSVDPNAFEKIMGKRDDIVEIDWLSKALERAKSVCKIELNDGSSGTGWLVGDNYIMTNHHVLESAASAKNARAIFNFQINRPGEEKYFSLDADKLFFSNQILDYALVAVKDDGNLSDYGKLEIESFAIPKEEELVNIIQHPKGKQKKLALPDEIISIWPENNQIFYLADTEPGSSGAPVFNQEWKVIALHHAGRSENQGGLVINEHGERKASNRGILIKAIVKDLKLKGVSIT